MAFRSASMEMAGMLICQRTGRKSAAWLVGQTRPCRLAGLCRTKDLKAGTLRTFGTTRSVYEKRYTSDHEWLDLSEDGKIGTIGVSTYAAKNLGDVVFVELPTADSEVSQGDAIGAVESVKSASDIMTPVSGKVVAINEVLGEKPSTINQSPESDGWIAKIELGSQGREEFGGLMDSEAYAKFVDE